MRSGGRRDVARGSVRAAAEEMAFHLALEVLARPLVRQVQAVLVDQHRLLLQPALPGFLADVFVDALAQFTGVRGEIEAFGLATELDAVDRAWHSRAPVDLLMRIWN